MTPDAMAEWRRGGPRPGVMPCGTNAAYIRHYRHGEKPYDACREAKSAYERGRRGRQESA